MNILVMTLLTAIYGSLFMLWEWRPWKPKAKLPYRSQSRGRAHVLRSDLREGTLWPDQGAPATPPPTLGRGSRVKEGWASGLGQ